MEKRKRGRPKVDTHLTQGHYDNRRKELNYKYMFEGTGVLMDAAEEIPEKHILYEVDIMSIFVLRLVKPVSLSSLVDCEFKTMPRLRIVSLLRTMLLMQSRLALE